MSELVSVQMNYKAGMNMGLHYIFNQPEILPQLIMFFNVGTDEIQHFIS